MMPIAGLNGNDNMVLGKAKILQNPCRTTGINMICFEVVGFVKTV